MRLTGKQPEPRTAGALRVHDFSPRPTALAFGRPGSQLTRMASCALRAQKRASSTRTLLAIAVSVSTSRARASTRPTCAFGRSATPS